jgi:predicted kinase
MPAVVVLIGPAAAGKTSLRQRLVDDGFDESLVVSLDDTRAWLQQRSRTAGRVTRPLAAYTPVALKVAAAKMRTLLEDGRGYLSDNTNLRRSERLAQVAAARDAGIPVVALLTPRIDLEELVERNQRRPAGLRVPDAILAGQHRRHQRLAPEQLWEEGFDAVWVVDAGSPLTLRHGRPPGTQEEG